MKKYETKDEARAAANARRRERYATDAAYRERVKASMRTPEVRARSARQKVEARESSPEARERYRSYMRRYERARRASDPSFRERKNAWRRARRKSDPNFKLAETLRRRLNIALGRSGARKSKSFAALAGCTVAELRQHLESKWLPGMTWSNHSPTGWHIDHIRPLASFDLTDEEQQREAFHYTNLQPLWGPGPDGNCAKGAKWEAA